jgi:hypothetical protein
MKKFALALLALATALAISPAAMADTFSFSFTSPNYAGGSSDVGASGNLQGTFSASEVGANIWQITSASILVFGGAVYEGGTGSLASAGTDGSDNLLYMNGAPSIAYVDNGGISFDLGTEWINIYTGFVSGSTQYGTFTGDGTNDYGIQEGPLSDTSGNTINFQNNGELVVSDTTPTSTPEPSSLLLLGTGLLGLALVAFRKAKPSRPVLDLCL